MKQILIMIAVLCASAASASQFLMATNPLVLHNGESFDHITFGAAPSLEMNGATRDDSFWVASEKLLLGGMFENDVWGIANDVIITGTCADHVRVAGRTVKVEGTISNGLWAAGISIATTTNSHIGGEQFLIADVLTLLGRIDGNLHARGRQITIGGTITGNVYMQGDDIVLRPGTVIDGNLVYVTTNLTIVLDDRSKVGGVLKKIDPVSVVEPSWSPVNNAMIQLFWFGGALVAGIPFIMLFPGITGGAVQQLRGGLWKCGLAGLVSLFFLPFLILAIAFTVIGLPLSLVLAAGYSLILYLGKFPVALAIGTALLQRRGQISLSSAVLALVSGLILYYGMALAPFIGASLQTAASAFGAGSLVMALAAARGRVTSNEKT